MDNDRFEAQHRAREYFNDLWLLPGAWPIVRVDGRRFSKFTEERFTKPFDEQFSEMMISATTALVEELGSVVAYTESDEISVLCHRGGTCSAARSRRSCPYRLAWRARRSRRRPVSRRTSTAGCGSAPRSRM